MPSSKTPRDRVIYKTISVLVLLFAFSFPTASYAATFGYTGTGASTANLDSKIRGSAFSLSENGDVTSMTAYLTKVGGGASSINVAIYTDAEVLVQGGTAITSNPATGAQTFTIASSLTAATYDLVAWANGNLFATHGMAYDTGAGHEIYYNGSAYGSFPASFTPNVDGTGARYSIYATYTADAGEPTLTPYTTIKGDVQMKGDVYFSP